MSKIGRKPILLQDVQVQVKGQEIHYKGKMGSGIHILPSELKAELSSNNKFLKITCSDVNRDSNRIWGLHRALLANELEGVGKGFINELVINGLGFKGVLTGNKIVFSLGFAHKIDFVLPKDITVEVDKTGQILKIKGINREQVGLVSSQIRRLRPAEPYKGTGIKLANEKIMRKAGKTKAA